MRILQTIQQDEVACADWDALTHTLQNLLEGDGVEGTSLFAGGDHSVRILNLHKAKGLEAAVIFLACPCGHSDHDAEAYIDRMAEPASGYFTISVPKDQYNNEVIGQPIGWSALSEKERGYMHAEADRLLYVAVTRAKQLLVVSRYPSKIAIDPWSELANSLDQHPELEDVSIKPAIAEKLMLAPDSLVSLRPWKDWVTSAAEPTYFRTNVTGQIKEGSEIKLVRPSGGRGMAFGSVVHRLIEVVGQGSTLDQVASYVRTIAQEEELDIK